MPEPGTLILLAAGLLGLLAYASLEETKSMDSGKGHSLRLEIGINQSVTGPEL